MTASMTSNLRLAKYIKMDHCNTNRTCSTIMGLSKEHHYYITYSYIWLQNVVQVHPMCNDIAPWMAKAHIRRGGLQAGAPETWYVGNVERRVPVRIRIGIIASDSQQLCGWDVSQTWTRWASDTSKRRSLQQARVINVSMCEDYSDSRSKQVPRRSPKDLIWSVCMLAAPFWMPLLRSNAAVFETAKWHKNCRPKLLMYHRLWRSGQQPERSFHCSWAWTEELLMLTAIIMTVSLWNSNALKTFEHDKGMNQFLENSLHQVAATRMSKHMQDINTQQIQASLSVLILTTILCCMKMIEDVSAGCSDVYTQ